jgi:predicted TIM-barrel fold metal-dependent hydrolase
MEHYLTDLVMSKLAMAEPISVLVFGQVFERFPALKFVTVESGAGWLAFVADYMDRTWEKQRFWVKSELKDYPSTYMDRNVYASFIHDSIGIATRHLPGAGNIMWSSDYPHSETTYPHSADMIERLMGNIGENDRAEIVGGRAARVFGI